MTTPTKELVLAEFKRLQDALPEGKVLTREQFRKGATVSTSAVEYHFGTFAELKRAAGAAPTRADNKLYSAIAKATMGSTRDAFGKEREDFGESYLRTDDSRYKTMLVISDLHDKEMDPFTLRVFLDTAKRVQPELVVLGGDVFDLPEFGRYNVDPREWDAVGRIKYAHEHIFAPLRAAVPDAQIDLIEGNHECITEDTEVLTDEGWITARDFYDLVNEPGLPVVPKIASFSLEDHTITYNDPIAVAQQKGRDIYEVDSLFKYERITSNHNLVTSAGCLNSLEEMQRWGTLDGLNLALTIEANNKDRDLELDISIVRLAVWMITTASVMRDPDGTPYLLFNKVPKRMERRIKSVAQAVDGVKWLKDRDTIYVRGPRLEALLEVITGQERVPHGTRWNQIPDWLDQLDNSYGKIVAEELAWGSTQNFMAQHTSYYNGHGHDVADHLQFFLATRGIPCMVNKLTNNQYILVFNDTGYPERWRGRRIKVKKKGLGSVISIQTVNKTLITRLNGRINFTGNCRLVKHLADFSPATRAILGDLHGMSIGDLFGLKKFEINYVAKADLKAYSAKEHDRELENNYRVYYDNVLVHHFPHARNFGMPGVNGHHHAHQVWPMFNIHQGAYEWHQLGAGHKRSASYCEGEKWHNGFALIHVDTLTKSVNIEYVPVTNMAVVGGKFYTREDHELIT